MERADRPPAATAKKHNSAKPLREEEVPVSIFAQSCCCCSGHYCIYSWNFKVCVMYTHVCVDTFLCEVFLGLEKRGRREGERIITQSGPR